MYCADESTQYIATDADHKTLIYLFCKAWSPKIRALSRYGHTFLRDRRPTGSWRIGIFRQRPARSAAWTAGDSVFSRSTALTSFVPLVTRSSHSPTPTPTSTAP